MIGEEEGVATFIGIFACESRVQAEALVEVLREEASLAATVKYDSKWTTGWSVECDVFAKDSHPSKEALFEQLKGLAHKADVDFLGWRHLEGTASFH